MPLVTLPRKVLIVSNFAPPASGGSPQVLFNLFSRIDPASYAIYTHEKNRRPGDPGRRLPGTHYFYASGARGLGPFGFLAAFARAVSEGLRIVKEEDAEVLVGTADKGTALLLTLVLSFLSGKPYVLYMLDPYRGSDFPGFRGLLADILEPIFFSFARLVITTNEGHRALYHKRYGDRFRYAVLYHASPAPASVPKPALGRSPYTILYTGSVYYAQEGSIRNLIRALEGMPDLDIRLALYVPRRIEETRASYAGHPCVTVSSAEPEEMAAIQRAADILFLPLSFGMSEGLLGMAVPGKTPEYLVAGKPILVHAPPDAYLCEYAREEGFATVVDQEDTELLQKAVRRLLTDEAYVGALVREAERAFEEHHDAEKDAGAFAELIGTA